jgi:hypothetical protein
MGLFKNLSVLKSCPKKYEKSWIKIGVDRAGYHWKIAKGKMEN